MSEHKKRTNKLWLRIAIIVLCVGLSIGGAMAILADGFNGDLDGDGKITAYDAQLLAEYQAGTRELTGAQVAGLTVRSILDWVLGKGEQTPDLAEGIVKTIQVDAEDGIVTEAVSFAEDGLSVTVPAGTKVTGTELTVTVKKLDASEGGLELEEGQELLPLDIHVEGVAADNTTPIVICVAEALDAGMNLGNLTLYHVENGVANPMTQVMDAAELTAHNSFYYDPATGDITVAMATFSEVAMISETDKAWNGGVDHSWYVGKESPYTIANADQLWSLSQIVGGMAKNENGEFILPLDEEGNPTRDSFAGDTINLIADINLADGEAANDAAKIFYPIGYYNSEGTYEKSGTAVTSGLYTFQGEFDGQGHTISNFYQNTWEMKGDHDWYAPEDQHYRDGMGLFGKVYGGTVKNLTVRNFKSDGEIATTGVIAAYADCGATFENIAIFECNPRVYNIGNGGIVGCVGWYAKDTVDKKVTFSNITVDNSNKISALWGSYDVACGGIVGQYYPTSGQSSANYPVNAGIAFDNCHVAAVMDVYNDVCANYQYYAYRYTGMMIGSIRENETINGRVYPKMTGIEAKDCTVHFGDWNDYYYCELVANSLASYTHDHQMSRLTQVKSVDVANKTITTLQGETVAIPDNSRVNYVVVKAQDANGAWIHGDGHDYAECYHFVNGVQHFHDVEDTDNPTPWEMVDGVETLKEDKQLVYREFNQLFTGYGWGVTSKGISDLEGIDIIDIKLGNYDESVQKFVLQAALPEINSGDVITLGQLFAYDNACGVTLKEENIKVAVTDLDETGISVTYTDPADAAWTESTLAFEGNGRVQITIQDYFFCKPTSIELTIEDRQPEVKFDKLFTNENFVYRIGDDNAVALGNLFAAKEGATIGTVDVTIENVSGTASGTYTSNAAWASGTIQFSGAGKVTVTITDNDYCIPTELTLEVVDATNVTSATNATANNVVLLKNCGFSSLEVSGGYTLYGNGFTLTCSSDSAALDFGYQFVKLEDGTLDNVQIVCPNFDYAALYKTNLTSSDNRSETTDKTRYYNAKSGVMASGNSQILNSRISGGRASVNVAGGNLLIENSRIELGAVASVLVNTANSVILRDVTLVQKPTESTYNNPSKTLIGFSVLVVCGGSGNATPITLEGELVQYAWIDKDDAAYVPSAGKTVATEALKQTGYLHDLDGDGVNESLNLGFAYMPESASSTVQKPTINDNRTNKTIVPYDYASVSGTYVYSYKNTNNEDLQWKEETTYNPSQYSDIVTTNYNVTVDGLTTDKSFETNRWVYVLNVDLDKLAGYALDFSKLSMFVNGVEVSDYQVNGTTEPTTVAVNAGGTEYILTDAAGHTAYVRVVGTETTKDSPSVVTKTLESAVLVGEAGNTASKDRFQIAVPVLNGIKIRYWSVAEKAYKEVDLSTCTPSTAGKQNGTNSDWTYTAPNNDFTLTIKSETLVHSSSTSYAMPVVVNSKLYFVATKDAALLNIPDNTEKSVTINYYFKDNNNGEELKFTCTWTRKWTNGEACYDYSDFCSGTAKTFNINKDNGCVTGDTLITLTDGSQVRVDALTGEEELLVWNLETGRYDTAPIVFVDSEEEAEYEVINLYFSDGSKVGVVYEHGFFDLDLGKYVYLDAYNAENYIGHTFVTQGDIADNTWNTAVLTDVVIEKKVTKVYSPVTFEHLCYYTDGVLSMPGGISGLFNIFEVDTEIMAYDAEKKAADIETYGLFTLEDFGGMITEEAFNAFNGAYLKVAIGKGLLTWEDIAYMAERYIPLM